MAAILDISVPLKTEKPVCLGSVGLQLWRNMSLDASDPVNVSRLDLDVQTGTYVEAPRHFLEDGNTVDQLPLGNLIGPATVAYLSKSTAVMDNELANLTLPPCIQRLLLRTPNSDLWAVGLTEFSKDYVALTADAFRWVMAQDIRFIGADYLSIQRYGDSPFTHLILLEAGVIILEGLNLACVQLGAYELIYLPLKLVGAKEVAPERAELRNVSAIKGRPQEDGGRS